MPHPAYPVPYILIPRAIVEHDAEPAGGPNKLGLQDNNGRRVCATEVLQRFGEYQIDNPHWMPPAILPTGNGGFEIGTLTEFAAQDRHKHESAIEIYTVLAGRMEIYIDDAGPHALDAGDEVVILPGAIHEVIQKKRRPRGPGETFELLVRVHAIGCRGADDKFVQLEAGGEWRRWSELSPEQRSAAYKLQARV
jgi:mannose-6-phosphate isomerase-like protein (cupin superfamily)